MSNPQKKYYAASDFWPDVALLAEKLSRIFVDGTRVYSGVYGVPRGGMALATALAAKFGLPLVDILHESGQVDMFIGPDGVLDPKDVLVVDDIIDSGTTRQKFPKSTFIALFEKPGAEYDVDEQIMPDTITLHCDDAWIHFFWEGEEEADSIKENVTRIMQYIGEDVRREGLVETPDRVVRSWEQLYGGYRVDPASVFKTFEEGASDQIVVLKDIEFYSMCEHHMLPFVGKAHIAYIPNGKVIGVSKLARLLDVFARRLQIQERLGEQITDALMEHLEPLGAACVIEAQHMCMQSRGVMKQNSVMKTSSMTGVFRKDAAARAEFFQLIK